MLLGPPFQPGALDAPAAAAADRRLWTLPAVLTPATIETHLKRALPGHGDTIHDIRFQVLRHHPERRCTLRIRFRTAKGPTSLIGKVYASDRSDVYRMMKAIWCAGFGRKDAYAIPEPLTYAPELRLLLQEDVDGPRAELAFVTGDARARASAAARAARWLARFHELGPRTGRVTKPTDATPAVARWSQRVAWLGERFAGRARRLAEHLAETAASYGAGERCPGHGSYDCHQIVLADGRTVTLDWDSYDTADPTRDVARFIVALRWLAAKQLSSLRALDDAADVFRKTYQALAPYDVEERLSWYVALTCLQLAKYEANNSESAAPDVVDALLDEGLRALGVPPTSVAAEADHDLPTLAAVLDGDQLARHLRGVVEWDPSEGIQVRVLRRKKADRCTLEIALKTVGQGEAPLASPLLRPREIGVRAAVGWYELIGKVYAQDRADVYRTMEEIRRAGFEPEAEFGIPRAVAYLAPLRLLLYEKAPGTPASKPLAMTHGPEAARAAERCARWLAHFHARAPCSGPTLQLSDQMSALERACRALVEFGSPLADPASRLFERLLTRSHHLGPGTPCPGHGTYTPGQVLLGEGRTVTIDWDTYQVADPSHDVARFLVELKRMAWKHTGATNALDAVAEVFLHTYMAASGSDVLERLAFQQAAVCLDRARQDLDKQGRAWREKAEATLHEGLRVLV